jgi:hypothetical protein
MTTAETIYLRVQALPEALAKEVLDFTEFLAGRAARIDDQRFIQAQASSLDSIWDNADDDIYNDA